MDKAENKTTDGKRRATAEYMCCHATQATVPLLQCQMDLMASSAPNVG
jgi:hypothetical protein